jgi:methyl-accepting chemotaxis protein
MATGQVNRGLQTVVSVMQEMSWSIREIAKNRTEAAKVADGTMKTALETNAIVGQPRGIERGNRAIDQGDYVDCSEYRPALNATVEAARAGKWAPASRWWQTR